MSVRAEVDFGVTIDTPTPQQIEQWAVAALTFKKPNSELCIRIVDEAEMTTLNDRYRNKNQPTNVLSFPADIPEEVETGLLGDIAICAPVIESEAVEQNKDLLAHWAHMVVHGCLHLTGYDHVADDEAMMMEATEIGILAALGYPNPYEETSAVNTSQQITDKSTSPKTELNNWVRNEYK